MSIGRQGVDMAAPPIQWKSPQTLNRIHQENASISAANLTNHLNRGAVAGQELNEADGQQLSPASGAGDLFYGVGDGQPYDVNTLFFQSLPGIIVGRKLLPEGHHTVAGLPIEPQGHRGNALRRVFNQY